MWRYQVRSSLNVKRGLEKQSFLKAFIEPCSPLPSCGTGGLPQVLYSWGPWPPEPLKLLGQSQWLDLIKGFVFGDVLWVLSSPRLCSGYFYPSGWRAEPLPGHFCMPWVFVELSPEPEQPQCSMQLQSPARLRKTHPNKPTQRDMG